MPATDRALAAPSPPPRAPSQLMLEENTSINHTQTQHRAMQQNGCPYAPGSLVTRSVTWPWGGQDGGGNVGVVVNQATFCPGESTTSYWPCPVSTR